MYPPFIAPVARDAVLPLALLPLVLQMNPRRFLGAAGKQQRRDELNVRSNAYLVAYKVLVEAVRVRELRQNTPVLIFMSSTISPLLRTVGTPAGEKTITWRTRLARFLRRRIFVCDSRVTVNHTRCG